MKKLIETTRDATEFFALNGISTEDKDWVGIYDWMVVHSGNKMQRV